MTLAVGDFELGLGSDDPETFERLRRLYDPWVVESGPTGARTTAGLGIRIPRRSGTGPLELPAVVHGDVALLTTHRVARLFRRVDVELGRIAAHDGSPRHLTKLSQFTAVVSAEGAMLVPLAFTNRTSAFERLLASNGLAVSEFSGTDVDLETLEIVIHGGLAGELPPGVLDDPVVATPGRYPLRGIVVDDHRIDPGGPRGPLLVRLVECVAEPGALDEQMRLERLAELARTVSVERVAAGELSLGSLAGLLRS